MAALAGVILVLAWTSPRWLAFNMDEFVHYHALGCATAPLAQDLDAYRARCSLYDLRLPFTSTYLPLRAYLYIGSLPAAVFLPFWALFDAPVAARVQGAVFLLIATALGARLLRVGPLTLLLASLVFPVYAFSFLADEGPVGLSAVLLLAALLSARRALGAARPAGECVWGAVAGLLLFAGLWVKLVFAWWLPAALAFVVVEGRRDARTAAAPRGRRRAALIAGVVAFLLPALALLASVDAEGHAYYATMSKARLSAAPARAGEVAARLARYVTDGSRIAPRNVELPPSPLDILPALTGLALIAAAILRRPERRLQVGLWTCCAAMTFALVASSAHSQWPHHVVFALLFLVFAVAKALEGTGPRATLAAALATALFWTSLVLRWSQATVPLDSNRAKDELLVFVREKGLDRETLQVHASWGTYYIAQLFGARERIVLDDRALSDNPRHVRELRELAREQGRPVLVVSSRRWGRLQNADVDAILGRPERVYPFGNWRALLYRLDRAD